MSGRGKADRAVVYPGLAVYVDAHSHLHLYQDDEIAVVLEDIADLGIVTVAVSLDVDSFLRTEEIARLSPLVIPAFGVHPWAAPEAVNSLDALEPHLSRSPMIGEIGLDHRFVADGSLYESQRVVFEWFLSKAFEQNKLTSIHCAGAEQEAYDLIRVHGVSRVIIHWYSGPMDVLDQMIAYGAHFSVGVEVLHSDHIRAIAKSIPTRQLITETDNPGGPKEVGGEPGYPALVVDVIEELARIRLTTPSAMARTVQDNWRSLVNDDPHIETRMRTR